MGRLSGKVAIITGATRGIGRGIAELFASEGAKVVLTGRDISSGENVLKGIKQDKSDAIFIHHDVTSQEDWNKVFEKTISTYAEVHILVNNAGIGECSDLETQTLEEWRRILAVNLDGTFMGTQLGIQNIKKYGGGSIINIASIAALVGTADLPAYTASKAGIKYFSKCAALHCGQRKYNIRVNTILPGLVRTEGGFSYVEEASGQKIEDLEEEISNSIPSGRICEPLDIAEGALYLASDESFMVNGTELVIDGGALAGK